MRPFMSEETLMYSTMVEMLQSRANERPNQEAYRFLLDGELNEESMTFAELDRRARVIGAKLQYMQAVGERVLLLYQPGLEYIAAFFGCLYAGSIAVPAYPPTSPRLIPRIHAIAMDCQAKIALTTSKLAANFKESFAALPEMNGVTWLATDQISEISENDWKTPDLNGQSLAFLQYTSGSTSTPKGVMVRHGNLLHNLSAIKESFGITPEDRGVIWLPPYHDMGLIGGILEPLYAGFHTTLMSPFDMMQRPLRWLQAISRTAASVSGGPNFAYELCVKRITDEQKAELDLSSWEVAFNGAEPIREETIERFAEAFASCGFKKEAFYTCYGLAEGTLFVSGGNRLTLPAIQRFDKEALTDNRVLEQPSSSDTATSQALVGCGQSVSDQTVCIVHPQTLRKCEADEIGEIWVAGRSVAGGYWGNEEQTAATFNAYVADSGEGPFLRTGDLGFLQNGELFVTGRLKDLIIIRGRNYYPQDIELSAQKSHFALRPECAAFSVQVNGEERLVIVSEIDRHHRQVDVEEVTSCIRQAVAQDHGVQVYAIQLVRYGSIPKTSSGKIQRRLCREIYLQDRFHVIGSHVLDDEPFEETIDPTVNRDALLRMGPEELQTELKAYLGNIIPRVLQISSSQYDAGQHLSTLGMDSARAMQLQYTIETDLGIVLNPTELFEVESSTKLSKLLAERLNGHHQVIANASKGEEEEYYVPLSRGQQALWFMHKLAPHSSAYNISKAVRIKGQMNVPVLIESFNELVSRHDVLRTAYPALENGLPLGYVRKNIEANVKIEDASTWDTITLHQRMEEEAHRPFDLEKGPLMRVQLFQTAPEDHVLLWSFHHIVIDLWSFDLLFSEWSQLYTKKAAGEKSYLEPVSVRFADYVLWQENMLADREGADQFAYWEKRLSGELPILNMPTDHPRPLVQTYNGAAKTIRLNGQTTVALKQLSKTYKTTLYTALLASYAVLLHRYAGQDDLIIGSPMAARSRSELVKLVGYVTNPVPIRVDLSGNPDFVTLLKKVRGIVLEAYAHQDYPFEVLVEKLQQERDASRSPIFQTAFVMQNVGGSYRRLAPLIAGGQKEGIELGNLLLEPVELNEQAAPFDLTMTVVEVGDVLSIELKYNTDLYEEPTIDRLLNSYATLLTEIANDPTQQVSTLPILSAEGKTHLLEMHHPAAAFPKEQCIHQWFERQAALHKGETAVVCGDERITYGELNSRANQLAHHLQQEGIGPDDLVGISVERSIEMIVCILGVLKAGGAYVPLDPAYPKERLEFMLKDSAVRILLTQKRLLSDLPKSDVKTLCVDSDWDAIAQNSSENPASGTTPDHLAYVIYTSGSTGKPKGVLIPHYQVIRLFQATEPWYSFTEQDVWTMFHSYAFDFSVWEIWGALLYGGRLVIVPYWISRSPEEFYRVLVKERVTVLNQTPSAFSQLMKAEKTIGMSDDLALRLVIFGGEALDIPSLGPWFDRHGDKRPQLVNMYGITETTVHVTYRPLSKADVDKQASFIGQPIPDLRIYILDQQLQPVPIGVAGEMFVGGAGVARGYLNRPELTKSRFIANPHNESEILYRTGDLVRFHANGDIEYLGRIDHQVKIRGFRIELNEIEAVIAKHPEVRDNIVFARNDLHGEKHLAAYAVVAPGSSLGSADLRRFLQERLPAFMVPSSFYLLDALPMTENGKVDRKALLAISPSKPESEAVYVPPATAEEEILVSVWENILHVQKIGIDDNFFNLGGDSIRSIAILSQARERGLDLSIQDLFQYQTIRELAAVAKRVQQHEESTGGKEPFGLISAEDRLLIPQQVEDAYPLSMTQAAFVYHSEMSSDYQVYLSSYRVRCLFDQAALEETLQQMVQRHHILRTSFDISHFSQPLQLVYREAAISLHVEDLRHLSHEQQQEHLSARLEQERKTPFDWQKPGLCRFYVCRYSDEEFQLVLIEPFLDGWSVVSLITELLTDYAAWVTNGQRPEKAPLQSSYRDFVELEQKTLQSEKARRFWNEKLSDCVITPLYRWPKSEAKQDNSKGRIWVPLSAKVSEGLRNLANTTAIPLKNVLLAGHLKVLSMLTGQTDVISGLIANGRLEHTDGDKVLGIFLNTLPLRAELSPGTWIDLVKTAFDSEREILPYRRYPLVQLQKEHSSGQPLFDVVFNYTHFHIAESLHSVPNVEIINAAQSDYTYVPLTAQFTVDINTSQVLFALDFETDELTEDQVETIGRYYQNVLEAMAENPLGRHEIQSFLTKEETDKLLVEWNSRRADYPVDQLFHALFAKQAGKTPEKPAVVFDGKELSYAELERKSNQLARFLQARGVERDVFVGYFGERNLEWVISIMAIWKAGGIYVPLDPAYPKERLTHMIEDADLKVLLTYDRLLGVFPEKNNISLCLDRDWETIAQESSEPVSANVKPEDVAYVIYTSGSTGKPKGAMVEHRGMVNHLYAKIDDLGMTEADRVAQNSSQCVDISVWQLFAVMLTGGRVVILKDEVAFDPSRQLDAMAHLQLTIVETVPSLLRAMLEEIALRDFKQPDLSSLRWMIPNGEVLPPELCKRWLGYYPNAYLINAYGPTECSDDVLHHFIKEPPGEEVATIPIGRPIANMQMYVLDKNRQPVPIGVAGELYIGGIGVGRGYLNAPEKNAQTFLENPFTQDDNPRLYKTGDLVRYRPDRSLEFLGRIDYQVKIRGFRIELGEIETLLGKHPAIEHVTVVAREDERGEKQLVAYFVAAAGMKPTKAELRDFLSQEIPEYMIPSSFMQLEEFPLTLNGKIDRKALPSPLTDVEEEQFVAPRSELEQQLASIWGEVLGYKRVGIRDHFFEHGGHSLLATQLISRIRKAFQIELPLRALFEAPTVEQLAELVQQALAPQSVQTELADLLEQIENLSDEEAEALLSQLKEK